MMRRRSLALGQRIYFSNKSKIFLAVEEAAHVLPNQGILENFIHHNPLKYFEHLEFKEAINHVHNNLESYMSPGERMFDLVDIDPRKRANEALVDLCASFLDRGAAKWAPQFRHLGFLYFFGHLECLGFASWRSYARSIAKRVMARKNCELSELAETVLMENLEFFGVPPDEWTCTVRSMMLDVRGWAGMFRRMQTHPLECPPRAKVDLMDFAVVQIILLRCSMESLARQSGWDDRSCSFATWLNKAPKVREKSDQSLHHPSAIAFVDQNSDSRETLEIEFERTLLNAIGTNSFSHHFGSSRPFLQLITCIDDRECSVRRHVEASNEEGFRVESFGVAGFFGVPIRYKPIDGREQMILAPEGANPSATLVESSCSLAKFRWRRFVAARLGLMWERASFSPLGSLALSFLAPFTLGKLWLVSFTPTLYRLTSGRLTEFFVPKPKTTFNSPFEAKEAAKLLASTMKDIGLTRLFGDVIVVLGHGSVSSNNPFFAAYNCGACGGREGGPNARLWAHLANDKNVRALLKANHDVHIPDDTVIVGAVHNTTADTVEFFDLECLSESQLENFAKAKSLIEKACAKNALERCGKFLLASHVQSPEEALNCVQTRSSDIAEVRPELNHATNAAVVIGRRLLTRGLFLDRRVFLPSYDPFSDDNRGTNLEHVLAPALLVCSGINLEYLFSTVSAEAHGAGTKAPLNIVGNVGVLQGTSGDLRPGLPSQMTEMHTPIRAIYVVDAPVERVQAVLSRRQNDLQKLVLNEWVRFVVRDPVTNLFYKEERGQYNIISENDQGSEGPGASHVPFVLHREHGLRVAKKEAFIFWTVTSSMLLSCAVPLLLFSGQAMNAHGSLIAIGGTSLALPILAFARRYLHGEFMFGRFSFLCGGLVLGFNLIAMAPNLELALAGWSLFGFASTFLIGSYNDRPTVRNNATFAFAAYQVSDFALLVAMTFCSPHHENHAVAAVALLVAALFKSSQFPLTALFVRSMEGPTPASALGYAGLSAHVGVVLLTGTMPIWFEFDLARATLFSVGLITAVHSSLIARIRADRKGAIANATSATLGMIFVVLSLGHDELALLLSFGHAAFRIIQILRSPSALADFQYFQSGLGRLPWPKQVPDWMYRLSWRLRRFHIDFNFVHLIHLASRVMHDSKPWKLSKLQQWFVTGFAIILAGVPFTPLSSFKEHVLERLLLDHPFAATVIKVIDFAVCVVLIRLVFVKVLSSGRFRKPYHLKAKEKK